MSRLTGPIFRPGQIVPRSAQYGVCDALGMYLGREATCVRGEPFPPMRHGTLEYGWRLRDLTVHR
jgi:hypothetical protein